MPADPGMLDGILLAFTLVLGLGWTGITPEALWLARVVSTIYILLTIPFIGAGLMDRLSEAVWSVAKVMLVVWAITNLRILTEAFANTIVRVGLVMGGNLMSLDEFMSPGAVMTQGWNATGPLLIFTQGMHSSWRLALQNWGAIAVYYFIVLLPMWAAFFMMALHIIVAIIEFQMVALFSVIWIPWAAFSKTAFVAEGAVNGILASGVRLGVLAFVTSVANPWIETIANAVGSGGEPGLWSSLSAAAAAALLGIMSWFAPNYAASFFGGRAAFTGSALIGMAAGAAVAGRRLIRG